jgi:hypothetical protein
LAQKSCKVFFLPALPPALLGKYLAMFQKPSLEAFVHFLGEQSPFLEKTTTFTLLPASKKRRAFFVLKS